jgi:hypothetical protein
MSSYNNNARNQAAASAFGPRSKFPPRPDWNLNQPQDPGSAPFTNQPSTSGGEFEPVDPELGTSVFPTEWKKRGPPATQSAFGILSFDTPPQTANSTFAERLTVASYTQRSEEAAAEPKRRKRAPASPPAQTAITLPQSSPSMIRDSANEKAPVQTSEGTSRPRVASSSELIDVAESRKADEFARWVAKKDQRQFERAARAHHRL